MSPTADALIRYTLLFALLGLAIAALVLLAGCVGAYRLERPLGPTKGDRFPVCDHASIPKTCERT